MRSSAKRMVMMISMVITDRRTRLTSARYWFGSPVISEAVLKVPGGELKIVAENNSDQNRYIQSVWLNGKEYRKPWISHKDLMAGGELRFVMGQEKKLWY